MSICIENKFCPRCKQTKSKIEFYTRRNGKDLSPYCKLCTNSQTLERQRTFKKKCIEFLGGKCVICGYNKCDGALEFHHLNPKEKEFCISKARLTSFNKKIEKELKKCILVCSNCHAEIHNKIINLSDI